MYQALGAKEILIEDITNTDVSNSTKSAKVNVDAKAEINKEILRIKKYNQGYFSPDLALKDIYFLRDYDNIMNVADARINGNQSIEEFTETININAGLDIDILGVFGNDTKFKYKRKWHFKVEFYDKNSL